MEICKRDVPKVVSLVALGESKLAFFNEAMQTGNRRGVADEVWVINKLGVIVKHDAIFRMDDIRIKYNCNDKKYNGGALPEAGLSVHDSYSDFLKNHDKPIITSKAYPEFPTSVEYPLEKVINNLGYAYLRTTPAYAAAFALYLGVKQLRIYGCDYNYPTDKYRAEAGRANMEFVLAICLERGMDIWTPPKTTLLDTDVDAFNMMYGYKEPVEVEDDKDDPGKFIVTARPDVGKKHRDSVKLKRREQLQELITEYRDEVKHDLIEGEWITIEDIENHERKKLKQKQLLDAPLRNEKGRFVKKSESLKGDDNDNTTKSDKRDN